MTDEEITSALLSGRTPYVIATASGELDDWLMVRVVQINNMLNPPSCYWHEYADENSSGEWCCVKCGHSLTEKPTSFYDTSNDF